MTSNQPATGPAPPSPRRFQLTRFFSITSLVGIVVVTAGLIGIYRELTIRTLVEHESRANEDVTRAFANTVWERYRGFIVGPRGRTREDLLADPMLPQLRAELLAKISGLEISKVKIYNLDGLTVFSTDDKQVGEDKSDNQGFRDASGGKASSVFVFREKFDAFEGTLSNRNLVASYIPVRLHPESAPEGVFEVYTDITEALELQNRAQWQVAGVVLAMLSTLYVFLFFVVRKADRIIAQQERDRAAKEEEIRHQAYHDALTGLPNRAYFTERLHEAVSLAGRHGHMCALMFIDLDRFKVVNDSLGHDAGDQLLNIVCARIRSCLRNSDILFRVGGDEFTVILPEVAAPEDAAIVARRIIDAVAAPTAIREHELTIGATIGIAVQPSDGDTAEQLLKNADAAMYSAKNNGRGTHAFYRAAMNQRALERLDLETALQRAFRDGEFVLHYQPRLDAATRGTVALEALLRWNSPTRGLVMPNDFIGVLEETGMMVVVGEWVLRQTCTQVRRWQQEGLRPLRVSVNVSSLQFQSAGFVAMVARVLRETGVAPPLVELELTESLLIRNAEQASATIGALKALGVSISIDDFGTGFSSLNYLRNLAVDYLKIDRSFVTEIATNPRDRAIANAIAELAKALGITVVAEGVETETQASFFSSIRCGELQGFMFSKALPPDQLRRFLAAAPEAVPVPAVPAWQRVP